MSMENLGPYTNFHELNQDWFLHEFNNLIAHWNAMQKNFDNFQDAFNDLKSYVQDYFKNLDVQNEINKKLDELVNNGKLDLLFNKWIKYVTPEEFGAVGDGIADDTDSLKKCFNQNKAILLTNKYKCSDNLIDNIGHNIFGDGTIISSCSGYILEINIPKNSNNNRRFSYNLRLYGNKINNGLKLLNSIGHVYNVKTFDVLTGMYISNNSSDTNDVYENIIDIQCEFGGGYGSFGVQCHRGDNIFNNVITINYETGFYNNGPTQIKYLHSWLSETGNDCWENSCVLKEYSNVFGCEIGMLYADTMRTGVYFNNYANTTINKYQLLINTNELPPTWKEHPHIVKSGKGGLTISQFHCYHEYSWYKFVKNTSDKYNFFINYISADPWINECSFSDIFFDINITKNMKLFNSLPPRLTDKFADGAVVCEAIGNGRYYQLWYYNSTGIFYSVNDNPTNALWKFVQTDYS